MAVVATTYAAIDRELLSMAAVWILAAGAWEGLCLGAAQARVLRRIGVRPLVWAALTAVAAIMGYALSLAGGAGAGTPTGAEPPAWLVPVLGAGLGVVMGMVMGAIQWIAARGIIFFWAWVLANAIGWALAMAIIMFAATLAERTWPLAFVAVLGAAAGALAGLSIGAVSGFVVGRAGRGANR